MRNNTKNPSRSTGDKYLLNVNQISQPLHW